MQSLESRYADAIERTKRIVHGTPEVDIAEIRAEIERLDHELRHTRMEPDRREELLKLSGAATAVLARQVHAARNPLVIDPAPHHPAPTRRGNAITDAACRYRDRGIER
ncbi:Uncharacterised protein [Nocardia otitidiscaviarum]|uniref:Uncharacterized protein n=1 Tax=Nocardia otitidiscaviarum TaxID=1823 RepID=A0A379JMM7_9NOCA|nr:hypothetical protein [Nocardia otitidiscaviarum]SUD49604.1 Uncharacterised protein [Nocardia otitidiscaviarum]